MNKLFTARVGSIYVPSDASHDSPEFLRGSWGGWFSTETFTAGLILLWARKKAESPMCAYVAKVVLRTVFFTIFHHLSRFI